jgi:hypothetical protein
MKESKLLYFKASDKRYFMPDTQQQGWGQITNAKTSLSETESNGVRTITRTPL